MESKSDFRQYYGPRASLLYLRPSPAIMWSAAAVLSGVWSHWPGRKHNRFQSQLLDAFMPLWKWLSSYHNPHPTCRCHPNCGSLESSVWLEYLLLMWWPVVKFFPLRGFVVFLTVWTLSHFSLESTPPLQCSYSLKGLDEEFTVGASDNLHTIAHQACE